MNLSDLQRATGDWAAMAFPEATDASILAHLQEELGELTRAVHEGEGDPAEEAADLLLILLHLCHRRGIDLSAAAARKFAVCRSRRWEQDEQKGYARHVPPEPLPHHISRDLFPAQGADAEAVCDQILTASGESLRREEGERPSLVIWDAGDGSRLEVEAGLERVLQAGERRRAAEEPPIEAGAGFAPGELARPNWSGVVGCEE
jgi:NTP pyrophosphatase (non-canonical NTP hydrolase)